MDQKQQINITDLRKYRTEIPNIYDDMDLSLMEFRLLVHYIRVGHCFESVRTTCSKCRMGKSSVVRTRRSLEKKGLISSQLNGKTYSIVVVDVWMKNFEKYNKNTTKNTVPSEERTVPSEERTVPSEERKKEPIKKEPIKNVDNHDFEKTRLLRITELIENVQLHHIWYYSTRRALEMDSSIFDNLLSEWAELNSAEFFNDKKHMCRSFKKFAMESKKTAKKYRPKSVETNKVLQGDFFHKKK